MVSVVEGKSTMLKETTKDKILAHGAQIIHQKGFKNTGIQEILYNAGVPKGSFYFYFKSKEDFGLEIIDYFNAIINGIFTRYLNDKKIPPLKRLEKLFDFYEAAFQKSGYSLGCPIGNLSLELADTNERLRVHLEGVIETRIKQ